MDLEEIRAVLAAYGTVPVNTSYERYEDSREWVGQMFGEKSQADNPFALALFRAAGMPIPEQPTK